MQTGPRLTITGACGECRHLDPAKTWIGGKRKLFCAEPSLLGRVPRMIGGPQRATPAWCPEMGRARIALFADLVRTLCRGCGRTVEPERECYAIPTCFACLPPPPPLPVLPSFAAWQKKQEEDSAARGAGEESA